MSDKHPSSAGEGRAAVGGSGPTQTPGERITGEDFIRTADPAAMSRKQRRFCDSKIERVRRERGFCKRRPF